jgi:hypothetical protein
MSLARPRLALRLWAQAHVARLIGKQHVLLEHAAEPGVVLCLDALGLLCIVTEEGGVAPTAAGLSAPGGGREPWPLLQLHRVGASARWFSWAVGAATPTELSTSAAQALATSKSRAPLLEPGRRMLIAAIEGYYMQHVLEPSVAGFLSILEKQFSRSGARPQQQQPLRPSAWHGSAARDVAPGSC